MPYFSWKVYGFFNVPRWTYKNGKYILWDGDYGLSSLSKKTWKSNHLQGVIIIITKAALSPQLF